MSRRSTKEPEKKSHQWHAGFLDRMFFSGLGGYATMTPEEQKEKQVLFDISTPKTQRRWLKKYLQLATNAQAHRAALRAVAGGGRRHRSAEEKLLGV